MEVATLKGQNRDAKGTRAANRLRRAGMVPGIVYGHGEEPQPVALPKHELELLLQHGTHLLELDVDGKPQRVLIKDIQYDYLGVEPVHIDLARVSMDERVTVVVPLEFKGVAKGTKEGGLLEQPVVSIEVECLATDIPDQIRVNVEPLEIGHSLHIRDLEMPPNVKPTGSPETIVCAVRALKVAATEEEIAEGEEGAAQPEVIGRAEKEEEEESSES